MLSVQYASPSPGLARYLYGYLQRVSEADQPEIIEPALARSGAMLEFHFGDPFDVQSYGLDRSVTAVPITVIGPLTARTARLVFRGRVEVLTVLFRPLGLYTIGGVPLTSFADIGTEGGAVLGAPIRALYEQLGNLRCFAERVKAIEAFLFPQLRQDRSLHPAHRALQALSSAGSLTTVREAAHEAGISPRQLERLSLEYNGISPIVLARLTRFQNALKLRQTRTESWAWIAHAAHYHDQMHMIREFRELAGNTPERALRELSPEHLISFMCQ